MTKQELPKSPFPHWLAFVLTNPFRKWSMNPASIVDLVGINTGQTVLEIGCGPGVFTEHLAAKVGIKGRIIAQDVQKQMLDKMERRKKHFAVHANIETLLANSSATNLATSGVDFIFAANVFEEIAKEKELAPTAAELYRVLKPEGRLFLGEHRVSSGLLNKILSAMTEAGFIEDKKLKDILFYAAVYRK